MTVRTRKPDTKLNDVVTHKNGTNELSIVRKRKSQMSMDACPKQPKEGLKLPRKKQDHMILFYTMNRHFKDWIDQYNNLNECMTMSQTIKKDLMIYVEKAKKLTSTRQQYK